MRTDKHGDSLWFKTYVLAENSVGHNVIQKNDGGFVATGGTYGNGRYVPFVLMVDSNGILLWSKINPWNPFETGLGRVIIQTQDGNFLIGGQSMEPAPNDGFIGKINNLGEPLWFKKYGTQNGDDIIYGLKELNNGDLIATGQVDWDVPYLNLWLLKFNSLGDTLWTRSFFAQRGNSIIQTADNGFAIVGLGHLDLPTTKGSVLFKTDEYGNLIWNQNYGWIGNGQLYSISSIDGRSYILGGYTDAIGAGEYDFLIIKTEPDYVTQIINQGGFTQHYTLEQNYPNPFNPSTIIKYQISEMNFVSLKVYDVLGNEIISLVNEEKPIGSYEVKFEANDLPSGVYLYQLKAGKFIQSKKMTLLK